MEIVETPNAELTGQGRESTNCLRAKHLPKPTMQKRADPPWSGRADVCDLFARNCQVWQGKGGGSRCRYRFS